MGACGFTQAEVLTHWEATARETADLNGVGFLYDHPLERLERCAGEFTALLQRLEADGYEYINMSDYAEAWTGRVAGAEIRCSDDAVYLDGVPAVGPFEYEVFPAPGRPDLLLSREGPRRLAIPPVYDLFPPPAPAILERVRAGQQTLDRSYGQSLWEWYARYWAGRYVPPVAMAALRGVLRRLRRRGALTAAALPSTAPARLAGDSASACGQPDSAVHAESDARRDGGDD